MASISRRREVRVLVGRERSVEALPPEPRTIRDLQHALSPRDVAERRGEEGGTVLFDGSLEIERDLLLVVELLGRDPLGDFFLAPYPPSRLFAISIATLMACNQTTEAGGLAEALVEYDTQAMKSV
jgi:hypothetical protein